MASTGSSCELDLQDPFNCQENVKAFIECWLRTNYVDMADFGQWEDVAEEMSTRTGIEKSPEWLRKTWIDKIDPMLSVLCKMSLPSREQLGWHDNVVTDEEERKNFEILSDRVLEVQKQRWRVNGSMDFQTETFRPHRVYPHEHFPVQFKTELPGSPPLDSDAFNRPKFIFANYSFHVLNCKKDIMGSVQATMTDYLIKLYGGTVEQDLSRCDKNTFFIAAFCDKENIRMLSYVRGVILSPTSITEWIKAEEAGIPIDVEKWVHKIDLTNVPPNGWLECDHRKIPRPVSASTIFGPSCSHGAHATCERSGAAQSASNSAVVRAASGLGLARNTSRYPVVAHSATNSAVVRAGSSFNCAQNTSRYPLAAHSATNSAVVRAGSSLNCARNTSRYTAAAPPATNSAVVQAGSSLSSARNISRPVEPVNYSTMSRMASTAADAAALVTSTTNRVRDIILPSLIEWQRLSGVSRNE